MRHERPTSAGRLAGRRCRQGSSRRSGCSRRLPARSPRATPDAVRLDVLDPGRGGVSVHAPSLLSRERHGYPSAMTMTARRYGAQSMSAPLLDVLVKRPGPAFGAAFDDPAHGFLHPVDLDRRPARARRVRRDAGRASVPRVHVLETELDSPDLVYTFDPLLVTDRGAIPLRPGKPNRAGEPAAIEAWTTRRRDPDGRPDRGAGHGRGRRHVLAPAGPVLHRADAADERRRAPRQLGAIWSAATSGSSTSRTGAARPSSSTSCRSSRRSPTTWRSSTCRSCRSGCGSCCGELGIRLDRGPRRGVPDARLQRPRGPARRRDPGRGQPA